MAFTTENKFDFVSRAVSEDTFGVVSFKGSEGFSKPYRFEITLVATDPEIDLDEVLRYPATFTILREEGDIPFHGILASFEQLHAVDNYVFYKALLVPKLWWLSLTHHNQVFLDKKVTQILGEVLEDGGLTTNDFELSIQKEYPDDTKWEYICQYRESHLNFVHRWLEREGLYYYFEQNDKAEKVIITDTKYSHTDMPQGKTMYYSPPSGLDERHREEVIKAFVLRQKLLPKSLHLKDYNYLTPSLEISGEAQVIPGGRGDVYIYGEHFRDPHEAKELAKIRAEGLLCHQKRFYGESTIPYLRPGYRFELEDHYRDGFNQTYLTIELEHEGSQAAYLLAGIQQGLSQVEKESYYRNSFVAITADVQFRPEHKTEKPRLYGTMNAKVDAAGGGQYAELDDHGRYKVIMPFDESVRSGGKASTWLRMAQPYAGTDHGMHFPLHKGTEVLLNFIDGDPDRPIIAAAVPNPETPSVIGDMNSTMSGFKSAGGNEFHMEDTEGHERVILKSGNKKSFFRMGSGSGDETFIKGDWQTTCAEYGASELNGITKNISSMAATSTLTGFMGYQLLKQLIGNLIKKIPDIVVSADKDVSIGAWTKIVAPITNLLSDLLTSKALGKIIGKKFKEGYRATPEEIQAKYGGNYCFSVISTDKATKVKQQCPITKGQKFALGAMFVGAAAGGAGLEAAGSADPKAAGGKGAAAIATAAGAGAAAGVVAALGLPDENSKGIFMGTTNGSIIFHGNEDFDVTAGNKAVIDAKRINATTTEGDVAKTSFVSKQFRVKTVDRFEIQTGKFKGSATKEHDESPGKGINIIAGEKHNINIKQEKSNNDGKIEMESKKEVKIKVGENTVTINKDKGIVVVAGKEIDFKVGKNTVTINGKGATIEGSSHVVAKVSGSKMTISDKEVNFTVKGNNVKVNTQQVQIG